MSVVVTPVSPRLGGVVFGLTDYEQVAGGDGGWEDIDRPRSTSAVGWVGTPAKTLTLPVILDGMEALGPGRDRVIELACAVVASWGVKHRETGMPPILMVAGVVTVSPAERWVVDSIDWGHYIRNTAGQRIQQELTLNLKRYQTAQVMLGPAAKARHKQKKKPKNHKGKK